MPVIYSPSGAVINLLELISLLFLSRIVMMRRRVTRDLIKSVPGGLSVFIIKRGSPGLVIMKIIQKEDILMLYLSVFKHPTLVRENIIALDLAREGLKRPIFNRSLQANRHIDSAARSNQIKSSSY